MPATGPDLPLTSRQEAAIGALLNQPTIAKAAEACGVNEKTIRRWFEQPAFSRAYRRARRESFSHAMSLSQRFAPSAIQSLAKILADAAAPHSAKVSAAATLLKFGRESIELDELAGRVEDLERAAAEQQGEQKGPRKWA